MWLQCVQGTLAQGLQHSGHAVGVSENGVTHFPEDATAPCSSFCSGLCLAQRIVIFYPKGLLLGGGRDSVGPMGLMGPVGVSRFALSVCELNQTRLMGGCALLTPSEHEVPSQQWQW